MNSNTPPPKSTSALPSPTSRTIISTVLFAYLFIVAVGLSSNLPSPLQQRLLYLFGAVIQPLNLGVEYTANYQLTHAAPLDVDHFIEVEIPAGGEPQKFRIPGEDRWRGGDAFRREQRLADLAAYWATIEGPDPAQKQFLPQLVARHFMSRYGVDEASIQVRAHMLQAREWVDSLDESLSNPNSPQRFQTVYDAKAIRLGDNVVNLLERSSALETAPAAAGGE